ncbi:MAG: hypothetical protein P8L37_08080 [Phycisphaerales bacterium]|nr:hypothetical protein [Phycisphaerales bacterium]
MTRGFWAGVDLLLGGLLLLAAFVLGMMDYDWRMVGVLGACFVVWGVIELVRDIFKSK